jgi:uncharacterized protein (TIGR02145 family)
MKKTILLFLVMIMSSVINAQTVTIGNQVWMRNNLNVDKFRNGDPIPEAKTDEEWRKAGENKQPAWCNYSNDPALGIKYGKLYNWFAVNDPRGLAPEGYHIPSDAEWTSLTDYLGGKLVAGKTMKSTNSWNVGTSGTNNSGFSGLPGGRRNYDGRFEFNGISGEWWSSTPNDMFSKVSAWYRTLSYGSSSVSIASNDKKGGVSVRCIKD